MRFLISVLWLCAICYSATSAYAQPVRIGILALFTCDRSAPFYPAMRELGYVEGKNIEYDCVVTHERLDEAQRLATEMAARKPALMMVSSTPLILAAQRATSSIPIVMFSSPDAVREGLVKSLSRPGGNTTGLTSISIDLLGKRLELAREMMPRARRLGVLHRRGGPPEFIRTFVSDLEAQAVRTRFETKLYAAASASEAATVIKQIAADGNDLLYVVESPVFTGPNAGEIARLALAHRLPIITASPRLADAGALLAYGPDLTHTARRAARYADQILKGAHPSKLPVEQPTVFNLTLNLRSARALNIGIPQTILIRADRLIE